MGQIFLWDRSCCRRERSVCRCGVYIDIESFARQSVKPRIGHAIVKNLTNQEFNEPVRFNARISPHRCPVAATIWVRKVEHAGSCPRPFQMKRLPHLSLFAVIATLLFCPGAQAQQRAQYEALVASHAQANGVPEALVHRVIVRESKYHPALIGRGGTIGLMQIKLATARGLGYTGSAEGLRDPETNLAYGVKYLAGAYRAANSDHARAMHYYASGYYYAAKRQRVARGRHAEPMFADAPPKDAGRSDQVAAETVAAAAEPTETAATPEASAAKPKLTSRIRAASKKLADAKALVPHPPLDITSRAHAAKPR